MEQCKTTHVLHSRSYTLTQVQTVKQVGAISCHLRSASSTWMNKKTWVLTFLPEMKERAALRGSVFRLVLFFDLLPNSNGAATVGGGIQDSKIETTKQITKIINACKNIYVIYQLWLNAELMKDERETRLMNQQPVNTFFLTLHLVTFLKHLEISKKRSHHFTLTCVKSSSVIM